MAEETISHGNSYAYSHVCSGCSSQFVGHKGRKYCSSECFYKNGHLKRTHEQVLKYSLSKRGELNPMKRKDVSTRVVETKRANGLFLPENHWHWNENREQVLANVGFAETCRGLLYKMLRYSLDESKKHVFTGELRYTPSQLREHLEQLFKPGMTWENHGLGGWHIDHIRPINTWPVGTPVSIVDALWNLRPLWEKENLSRSHTWPLKDFKIYLPSSTMRMF